MWGWSFRIGHIRYLISFLQNFTLPHIYFILYVEINIYLIFLENSEIYLNEDNEDTMIANSSRKFKKSEDAIKLNIGDLKRLGIRGCICKLYYEDERELRQ